MSDDETIPAPAHWSVEAEQAVLGGLMLDNAAWDRTGDLLQARHFFAAQHRAIYVAIGSLVNASKPADVITVYAALQARKIDDVAASITLGELNELVSSVASAQSIRAYALIVHEHWQQRVLLAASDRALAISRAPGPATEKLNAIVAGFGELERQHVREVPRRLGELMVEQLDHISDMATGNVTPGWSTGMPQLDVLLKGGFHPGRVYLIGGRPGKGKSALALWCGVHLSLLDNLVTLYLSQEMPASEVTERAISTVGQISYTAVQTGKLSDQEWGKLTDTSAKLAAIEFHVDAQSGLSASDIRIKARYVKGLNILVLDYVQLCKGTGEGESSRNEEIGAISRALKGLAKDRNCAVLVLSGLSRKVDERAHKRAIMSDFRDSGQLEADADVIMSLFELRAKDSRGARIMGIDILKNRQGSEGCIAVDFWGDLMSWSESQYRAEDLLKPAKGVKEDL